MPLAREATPRPHIPYPHTTIVRPASSRFVDRMIASIVDCPVPNRLSNRCFVSASFTETIAYFSAPSTAIARSRITPVVVSSVPPMISAIWSGRSLCSDAHHVGAVVHRDVRVRVEHLVDVPEERLGVLALHRERRDAALLAERRRHVVLGRERVRRAERDLRAAGRERLHQVRGLGRHVQARRDPDAGQRLLLLETLADQRQHRHLARRPLDPLAPFRRERQIPHVTSHLQLLRRSAAAGPPAACPPPWRSRSIRARPLRG